MRLAPPRFGGQFDPFVSDPDVHLPRALELGEFREDELNGLLHALVRILLDPAAPDFHVARGYAENQVAATRHLTQRLLRALAEQRQLEFAHRAFRTHDILPSNSRLRSSSGIRTTRMPANDSRLFGVSFTPAMRISSSSCRMASG